MSSCSARGEKRGGKARPKGSGTSAVDASPITLEGSKMGANRRVLTRTKTDIRTEVECEDASRRNTLETARQITERHSVVGGRVKHEHQDCRSSPDRHCAAGSLRRCGPPGFGRRFEI